MYLRGEFYKNTAVVNTKGVRVGSDKERSLRHHTT